MIQIIHHDYYCNGGVEAIEFIDTHNLNFNLGNVVQYVSKAGRKDGEDTLTALKKAQWYLKREIHRLEGNK